MSETERPLRPARIPLRALATGLAVFALLAPFANTWGLTSAVACALLGVFAGEGFAWSRGRTGVGIGLSVAVLLLGALSTWLLVQVPFSSSLMGGPTALVLSSVLGLGLGSFGVVSALRLCARRVPTLQVVELGALALATATAFAAHRDGALARPLWLTDRAWQLGVDPGAVLLAIGAAAAAMIAMLQLLETRHRLPWFSWVWLPVIALFAFLLADVSIEETQTAQDLEAIQSAMDGQPTSAAGTGEEPEDGEDGEPVKPELGEDGEPVKPELGEDGEPVKPELGEDGEPVKPELGEDGEPIEPELGEDGEPVKPEPGDGEPQPAGPDGETPATPEEGEGTADAGDPSDGQPQGGKPEDGKPSDGEAQGGDPPQAGEAQPQDGEPQDGEPQDGEPQDGEPQDGEPQEDEADTPPPKEQPDLEDEPSESPKPKNNPVAVLLLGDDYTPLNGYFYLRQEVQSQFVGTRLVPAERTDVDLDIIEGFPTGPTDVTEPTPEEGHKVVHGKVAILADHTAPFGLDAPVSYAPAYNPNPARFLRAWTFVAHAPITPYEELIGHTSGAAWQEDVRDYYLAYPEDDPRYLELVETLVEGLRPEMQDDPFAKALVIKQHLDQMAYDTSERHAGATDPTAEFLFEGDEMVGYCVHAAHAATYLLRAAGVPARVGTGYAVEEERRRGSSIVVMGKDAHAWPELYLDDVGWTIVDIAPAENRDPEAEPIDEEFNDLLSDMAREEPDSEEVASYDWRGLWHSTLRTLRNAAVALAAFVIVLHYLVKLWRRTRPYLATHRGIARVGYRAAIDRLVEAGHVRETGETRERFARRIAGDVPTFKALTDLHVQAKLGHPDAEGPRSTSTWLRMLGQLNREIAASSGWSRWIAVANPFSFYRSR